MAEETRNDLIYVIAEVEKLNPKGAKCIVDTVEGKYLVQFPQFVVESLNLSPGQKFYWYPQPRDTVLPEDCSLEPRVQEVIDWEDAAEREFRDIYHLIPNRTWENKERK